MEIGGLEPLSGIALGELEEVLAARKSGLVYCRDWHNNMN